MCTSMTLSFVVGMDMLVVLVAIHWSLFASMGYWGSR
jgi:hypothetical protein